MRVGRGVMHSLWDVCACAVAWTLGLGCPEQLAPPPFPLSEGELVPVQGKCQSSLLSIVPDSCLLVMVSIRLSIFQGDELFPM